MTESYKYFFAVCHPPGRHRPCRPYSTNWRHWVVRGESDCPSWTRGRPLLVTGDGRGVYRGALGGDPWSSAGWCRGEGGVPQWAWCGSPKAAQAIGNAGTNNVLGVERLRSSQSREIRPWRETQLTCSVLPTTCCQIAHARGLTS